MTPLPRYHYQFYKDASHPENRWASRDQWLIFDRHSIGCMSSLCTEREAARIVFALNKLDASKDARQFEEVPWREAQRDRFKETA